MKRLTLKLANRSYPIVIGHKITSEAGSILKNLKMGKDAVVISNPKIWSLYGSSLMRSLKMQGISISCEKVPDKETSKSNKEATRLIQKISQLDRHRGTFIVAFGGGVVGDLAGFVASIYKRGIPYVQIPTTLLGQVDSAIGGKVAIDTDLAKNLIGAFYQPRAVISDISFLKSLPAREIRSGFAEIIKYGIIADKNLFFFIEKNIKKLLKRDKTSLEYVIYKCSKIKADVVRRDEKDTKGIRAILNYGHTVGHAIEAASGYSKLYTHGEAIAVGMIIAAEISNELGLLKEKDLERIESLIKIIGLSTKIKSLKLKKIMDAQSYDKKIIHGVNRFILPTRIGKVKICENISKKMIANIIARRLKCK